MKAALIVNPGLKDAEAATRAVAVASAARGWESPLILLTTTRQPGGPQAARALAAGVDRILAVGGDGTLRQVAGAMAKAGTLVPLGIVPVGAADIVARNIGVRPGRLRQAVAIALDGPPRPLSVGWVTCRRDGHEPAAEPMLIVAGIGRDALAIATIRPWLKSHAGWLAYAEAGGRQALRRGVPMTVSIDGGPAEMVQAWSVLAAILPRLPMGVVAFPGTVVGGDAMQVLEVRLRQLADWGPVAIKGLAHTDADVAALRYIPARQVEIEPRRPLPVQIDGDLVRDVQALRVSLQPAAVRVAAPGGTASGGATPGGVAPGGAA